MDILLVVVLVILSGFGLHGYRKGLIRVVFSLVAIVLSIGLATTLTPHITEFLRTQTPLYHTVQEKCTEYIQDTMQEQIQQKKENGESVQELNILGFKVPKEFQDIFMGDAAGKANELLEDAGIYHKLGSFVAEQVLQRGAWALSFAITSLILFALVHFLDLIAKLPVLKSLNRMGGLAVGLLQGLIVVWILFLVAVLCQGSDWGKQMMDSIYGNAFLKLIYDHNIIEKIIMGGFGK